MTSFLNFLAFVALFFSFVFFLAAAMLVQNSLFIPCAIAFVIGWILSTLAEKEAR